MGAALTITPWSLASNPKQASEQFHKDQVHRRAGWQPTRFLADRAEVERAFQLAERLGSINAAAAEPGTT